jgi:hypothetical protein
MLGLALRTSALRINANIESNAPTVGERLSDRANRYAASRDLPGYA